MNKKTEHTIQLLGAAEQDGQRLSISRARRLAQREARRAAQDAHQRPSSSVEGSTLTYADPTGEDATRRAHQTTKVRKTE